MVEKKLTCLSVRVGNQWYGIEVDQIIEVFHLIAFTELPSLREDILGLITVRNEVMPLIDLRRRLGVTETPLTLDTPVVAIRSENIALALLFDDADQVEEIAESQVTAYHNVQQFPYIRAAARLPERLFLLLDTSFISKEIQNLMGDMIPR